MVQKGLVVDVMRSSRGVASNGDSSRFDSLLLVGEGIPELFESRGEPVYELSIGALGHVVAKPFGDNSWLQFSGAFVYTSDSRLGEAVRSMDAKWDGYCVPIFDRNESKPFDTTQYRLLRIARESDSGDRIVLPVSIAFDMDLHERAVAEYVMVSLLSEASVHDDGKVSGSVQDGLFSGHLKCDEIRYCTKDQAEFINGKVDFSVTREAYQAWIEARPVSEMKVLQGADGKYWDGTGWCFYSCAQRFTPNDRYRLAEHRIPTYLDGDGVPQKGSFVKANDLPF